MRLIIYKISFILLINGLIFNQINISLNQESRTVPLLGLNNSSMRYNNYNNSGIFYNWTNEEFQESALCFHPNIIRYPGGNESSYWDWQNGWVLPSENIIEHVNNLNLLYDSYHEEPTNGDYFFSLSTEEYNWWDNSDGTWNPADIGIVEFSDFINHNNIQGTYVLNMLTEDISTTKNKISDFHNSNGVLFQHFELGNEYYLRSGGDKWDDVNNNFMYDPGETLTNDHDEDGTFDPGRYEFIYPSPIEFAQECNLWIDSLSQVVQNAKFGVTAKNKPGDPRSHDWNRQVLSELNFSLLDTFYLAWHEYLTYRHDNDVPLTAEQVLAFPQFKLNNLLKDGGMHPDSIALLEVEFGKTIRLWLTESNFREKEFGSVDNQPWIFKWAHTLVNVYYFSLIMENPYVDMMLLHSLHGWSTTSSINHGNGFPQDFPEYENQDSCSPYGRTASGFSAYFWNYITDGMTEMHEFTFSSENNNHMGVISSDPANNSYSPDLGFEYSLLHGWKLSNSVTGEEKALLINIADSAMILQFDSNTSLFNNLNMRRVGITHLNSEGIPSIDQYITGDGDLSFDTTNVFSGMVLPPYSINLFEPYAGYSYPWHISNEGSDIEGNGSSENPFATIQHGLDLANEGDMILVSAGTYYENITWPATHGINLIGSSEEDCIIDGNQIERVILFDNSEIDPTTLISRFTIQNGLGSTAGGGIRCVSSSPRIENIKISNNSAPAGGGICCVTDSSPILTNVMITGNTATTTGDGGGIKCKDNSSPILTNVTITENTAVDNGGAISCKNNSNPSLVNCILWNNSPQEIYFHVFASNSAGDTLTIGFSDIDDGEPGIELNNNGVINWLDGNLVIDPQFTSSDAGDYTLQSTSPCIDSGDPNSKMDPDGTRADMGAYTYYHIFGCMDMNACNYDVNATDDDANCLYFDICDICGGDNSGCFTVTDIDDNIYNIVQIGNQIWMADNLKVVHYNNGDEMPTGYSTDQWGLLTTAAYTVYGNDPSNVDTYGNLFNWYAVDDERNICPDGWDVPSDEDWKQLEMYLGMSQVEADDIFDRGTEEGGKLKEIGTEHWDSPNAGATNESGFSALPGGSCWGDDCTNLGKKTFYWSSTGTSGNATLRGLNYDNAMISRVTQSMKSGLSVRCIKVNTIFIPQDYSTIQQGIDAASDGDTVLVASGTYYENIDYKKKNIVVMSHEGSDSTIIDGMANGSVVIMDTTINAELIGFHLTNGLASAGGGIKSTAGNIKLKDLIIEGNQADYGYSIIGTMQSKITVDDLIVYNNLSSQMIIGAGLYFRDASEITINHSTLINNFSAEINPAHSLKIFGGTTLTLNNTILWNMDDGNVLESYNGWGNNIINITYSDIEGGVDSVLQTGDGTSLINWSENNIYSDPLFCDPDSSNYTLAENSPCIGTSQDGANMGALGVGCEEILYNENVTLPSQYSLHTYPNPFNPVTTILFSTPQLGLVFIRVYDITGRELETLANSNFNPGNYRFNWNASVYPSGIYFVKMIAGEFQSTQKLILVK